MRRTKSRIRFDNILWFISLLSTTKNKFPKINSHNIELMTYLCTCSWETTNNIASSHIILSLMVKNSNKNSNYYIVSFMDQIGYLEFKKSSINLHNYSVECLLIDHCRTNSFKNRLIPVHLIENWGFSIQEHV